MRSPRSFMARRSWVVTDLGSSTIDRKSTRLNSSHSQISYAVFCLKKKNDKSPPTIHLNSIKPLLAYLFVPTTETHISASVCIHHLATPAYSHRSPHLTHRSPPLDT